MWCNSTSKLTQSIETPPAIQTFFLRLHRARLIADDELSQRAAALLLVDAANYITSQGFFERNAHFFCCKTGRSYAHRPDDYLLKRGICLIEGQFQQIPVEMWNEDSVKRAFDCVIDEMSKVWEVDRDRDPSGTRECRTAVQHFLRWALTGGSPGPALIFSMSLLGRDVSLARIEDAAAAFKTLKLEAE